MTAFVITRFGAPLECRPVAPPPEPSGAEVLLRVTACGICHSDLHIQDGHFDLGEGNRVDLSRSLHLPLVPGHEIAGEVIALGPEARGVALGEQRVVYPWIGCGRCAVCAEGEEHLCAAPRVLGVNRDGGFATTVLVPEARYLLPHAGLAPAQAATLACSGLTAYAALRKLLPFPKAGALLVIGAGGVGLSGIRMATRVLGVAPIVAEPDRRKWDAVQAAGAATVIDPQEPGVLKALLKQTGGVAGAIDFVGSARSFDVGFAALRKGGRLVMVGLLGGATRFAPALVPLKAATIIGSYVGTLEELRALLALAPDLPSLPVERLPLAAAQAGLDRLREGGVVGRLVLAPG